MSGALSLSSSSLDNDGAGDSGQTAGNAAPSPILAAAPPPRHLHLVSLTHRLDAGVGWHPSEKTIQLGPPPLLIIVVDGRRHFGGAIHTDY